MTLITPYRPLNRALSAIRIAALAGFSLVLAACAPETPSYPELTACVAESNDSVELSFGWHDVTRDGDEGHLHFEAGFQGGYHAYAAVGLAVEPVAPVYATFHVCHEDAVIARNRVELRFSEDSSQFRSGSHLVYVLHGYTPAQLHETPATMAVRLTDAAGRSWETRREADGFCCD